MRSDSIIPGSKRRSHDRVPSPCDKDVISGTRQRLGNADRTGTTNKHEIVPGPRNRHAFSPVCCTDDNSTEITVMITKSTGLAIAAACLITISSMPRAQAQTAREQTASGAQMVTNGPQTDPGDVSPYWSPQQNET